MRNGRTEFFQPALAVLDLLIEQILMMVIQRLAFKIFIITVAEGHRGPGQDIFDPTVQARLLPLGRVQRFLDRDQNRLYAAPVGLSIPFRRTRAESPFAAKT